MEIYLLGRRLVMIVETDGRDVHRCFAAHAASHPRVVEWEALMKGMQEAVPGTAPGEWWTQMERVFHLSDKETASDAAPSAPSGRSRRPDRVPRAGRR
jgi:L-rhamnose mutarotase